MLFLSSGCKENEIFINSQTFSLFFYVPFFKKVRFIKKVGKLPVSHRYNRLPLLPSDPGGIQQELVAQDLPGCKSRNFSFPAKQNMPNKILFIAKSHIPHSQ